MVDSAHRLRVALLAGALSQGGAEKQLLYMARALHEANVDVRVYTLTRGQFYEPALRAIGLEPRWIGQFGHPLLRLSRLTRELRRFRPHILQSSHFFSNLHVTLAGRLQRIVTTGALRNDAVFEVKKSGRLGKRLLHMPPGLIANSFAARHNAESLGVPGERVHILPNVIDLAHFDAQELQDEAPIAQNDQPVVMAVCRLVAQKRLDRFLAALSLARREAPDLKGCIVGEGPEQPKLEAQARELGLSSDNLVFLGRRDDVPAVLKQAGFLVLSSDHEGFPNVVLEGMAAQLPVIATPAGDAAVVIQEGTTGHIVAFDDVAAMAGHMVQLAKSPHLRHSLGKAGRERVEQQYSFEGLADRLFAIYRSMAQQQDNRRALDILS